MEIDSAAERLAAVVAAMPPGPSRLRFEEVLSRLRESPPAAGAPAGPGPGAPVPDPSAPGIDGPAPVEHPVGADESGAGSEAGLDDHDTDNGVDDEDDYEDEEGADDLALDTDEAYDPLQDEEDEDDAALVADPEPGDDGRGTDVEAVLGELEVEEPVDAATTSDDEVAAAPWDDGDDDHWSDGSTIDTGQIPTVTAPVTAPVPTPAPPPAPPVARPRPNPGPLPLPEKRGWWRRQT